MATVGAVKAGAAYVEAFLEDNKLRRGLGEAERRLKSFAQSLTSSGAILTGVGGSILTPLALVTREYAQAGNALEEMAARTSISVKTLSELQYAANITGASIADLESAIQSMQQKIAAGILGGANLRAASTEAQFELIAQAISEIDDPTRRAAAAMQVFGTAGAKLLPIIQQGAAGMDRLKQEAANLGISFDDAAAAKARETAIAVAKLEASFKALRLELGAALAPAVTLVLDKITPLISSGINWIKNNRELVVTIAAITTGVLGAGVALLALAGGATVASFAIGALSAAVSALGVVIAAVFSPVGLVIGGVVAVVAGLAYWFATTTDEGRKMVNEIKSGFVELLDIGSRTLGGIFDALSLGRYELAWNAALASIKLAWVSFISFLQNQWDNFTRPFVEYWHAFKFLVARQIIDIEARWDKFTSFLALGFKIAFSQVANAVLSLTELILEQINRIDPTDTIQSGIDAVRRLREATAAGLNADIVKAAEKISQAEKDRLATRKALNEMEIQEILERQRERAEAREARARRVAEARAELEAILAQIEALKVKKAVEEPKVVRSQPRQITQLFGSAGTFNAGLAGQSLGLASEIKKQTDLLTELNNRVERIEGVARVSFK